MPTVRITTIWEDSEGRRQSVPLYFDSLDITTLASAQTAYVAYETLMLAISGASIVEAEVTFGIAVAGGQTPDSGYNVRSGAYLSFENSDDVGDGLYLPAILENDIANGVVNPDDADVAAFIAQATSGSPPLSTRGSASLWSDFIRGRETVRKPSR